jgi:hypothetical protein
MCIKELEIFFSYVEKQRSWVGVPLTKMAGKFSNIY